MQHINDYSYMAFERPALMGTLKGGPGAENADGTAAVFWLPGALYLQAEFTGLPPSEVFGFHIHEGYICGEPREDGSFAGTGEHYSNCPEDMWCGRHPYHAGDLPPVFSDAEGKASMQVYLDKASVEEISGRVVILHSMRDDMTSQPAGDSGKRIVCGVLAEYL